MPTPMIRIHNAETGEVIDREMNAEELAQHKKNQEAELEIDAAITEKAAARAAILERLGLTNDEANLLLS